MYRTTMYICLFLHAFSIYLVIETLISDYKNEKFARKFKIRETYPSFSLKNPYSDIQNIRNDINYKRLIDFDFKFMVKPKVTCDKPFLLIIVISSALYNLGKRLVIRNTWGRIKCDSVKLVFTVGLTEDSHTEINIRKEIRAFRDIVRGNFMDSYYNMSYKHVMGLKWVHHHCNTARYVLKTDDDIFVNNGQLLKFLIREMSPWGAEGLIAGVIMMDMEVNRSGYSKWYMPYEEYNGRYYPDFCSGAAILYSQDVVPALVEASQSVDYLHVDDVFVSGVLVNTCQYTRTDISYQIMLAKDLPRFFKRGFHAVKPFMFGPTALLNEKPYIIPMMWQIMPGVNEMFL